MNRYEEGSSHESWIKSYGAAFWSFHILPIHHYLLHESFCRFITKVSTWLRFGPTFWTLIGTTVVLVNGSMLLGLPQADMFLLIQIHREWFDLEMSPWSKSWRYQKLACWYVKKNCVSKMFINNFLFRQRFSNMSWDIIRRCHPSKSNSQCLASFQGMQESTIIQWDMDNNAGNVFSLGISVRFSACSWWRRCFEQDHDAERELRSSC